MAIEVERVLDARGIADSTWNSQEKEEDLILGVVIHISYV
jgi:hypothetical protein